MRPAHMLALLGLACASTHAVPMGVHVGFGPTEDSLAVAWTTAGGNGESEVLWGTSADALTNRAAGDAKKFTADIIRKWYTRTATMTGLAVGARYYYKVGDSVNGYSQVFSVRNRKAGPPYNHVLFGDMGASAAFSLCNACTEGSSVCNAATCAGNTTAGLVSEVGENGAADMFLHVGDFAYNFGTNGGKLGDQFMDNIEQVAARVPYMVSHGNHEDAPAALAHYVERFRHMPVNSEPATYKTLNGEGPNNMYFSWNFGLVHYISFSTELFHLPVSLYSLKVTKRTFLAWLEKDLQEANKPENRKAYPWIVIHGHRPLYSSALEGGDQTLRKAMEDLLFRYGVSFSVNGHEHDYERSFPVYKDKADQSYVDPKAPVYIVTGAAGCKELHDPFAKQRPGWVGFRSNTFGYTRMIVHNASHIHFQQVSTDPTTFPLSEYGKIVDDYWVVQHNQGPFDVATAPKEVPETCYGAPLCGDHDHFAPLLLPRLGEPAGSKRPLHEVIAQYRKEQGEVAWARELEYLMSLMNTGAKETGALGEWEDGLLDEKELAAFKWVSGHKQ